MDPITILAGLVPLGLDLGKSLISKFLGTDTFKPANIDDYVKMKSIDLDMFKAMNDAGGANSSYPWVEAIVRLMRPGIALSVLGVWGILHLTTGADTTTVDNFASSIGFYLFGDRTLFLSRPVNKK